MDPTSDLSEAKDGMAASSLSAPATAAATAPSSFQADCFKLGNGYVELAEPPAASAAAQSTSGSGGEEPAEKVAPKRRRAFWFHNRHLTDALLLYGNQVTHLVEVLPAAFAAYKNVDYSYNYQLAKTKGQLITLEVSPFNERTYLFLKKYFKPRVGGEIDEESDWIPSGTVITLDPSKDDPQALLKFVLSAHRRQSH